MTSFARGTPPEVIAAVEKELAKRRKNAGPNMIPAPPVVRDVGTGNPRGGMIPMPPPPPVPDKDNPLYDSPVRPDEPKTVQSPRQVRNQAIASAKDTRQKAMQAARAMKDRGQRLSAKQSALDAYANARNAAQQKYRASRTGISSPGGPGSTGGSGPLYMKKGGSVKKYAVGGSVSASKRADGCAIKGKTRGRIV